MFNLFTLLIIVDVEEKYPINNQQHIKVFPISNLFKQHSYSCVSDVYVVYLEVCIVYSTELQQ